jgi:hypothetical protein
MSFGGTPFAESTLAGALLEVDEVVAPGPEPPIGGSAGVPLVFDPFTVEISGESVKPLVGSLSIDIELGRQGTASFTMVRLSSIPRIGEPVRIKFYEQILFVGAIDSLRMTSNNTESYKEFAIECTDNSYLLFRRIVKRSFTNASLSSIAQSLLTQELGGDGITLGTIDNFPVIPLVDADRVSAFDMLNDAAVSVGALFYIDNDKRLNFLGASIENAPMTIDENIAQETEVSFDRETYRNQQTVIVTGTPATTGTAANTVTYKTTNNDQYLQQSAIEGTSGLYGDIESITHPTSNSPTDLTKLGVAFAKIMLSVRGSIRETLRVKTQQYGFRVGQIAIVSIPQLHREGNWIIQSISQSDIMGRYLSTTMRLSPGSLQRRAQELWLDVVRKGKTVILPPTIITTSTQVFSTPGTHSFTVPAGATVVQFTCKGGGGGGGGGAIHTYPNYLLHYARGGDGGNGGQTITVVDAVPGEVFTLVVPAGGTAGASTTINGVLAAAQGVSGGNGGTAQVKRNGNFSICDANGGEGGFGGRAYAILHQEFSPTKGSDGSGLFGQSVTVGGGARGGLGGRGVPLINGTAGAAGSITEEW